MTRSRSGAVAGVLLALALPLAAQEAPRPTLRVRLQPERPTAGQACALELELEIPPEWHIYATQTPNGLPTRVALTLPAGWTAGALEEPAASEEEIEYVGPVRLLRGRVVLRYPLQVPAGSPAQAELSAQVAYQTCDDANTMCVQGELSGRLAVELAPAPAADASPGGAQPPGGEPEPGGGLGLGLGLGLGDDEAGPEVTVRARLEPGEARPGAELSLVLEAEVPEGWHIYSVTTPSGKGSATQVRLELPPGLELAGPLQEPPPRLHEVPFVGEVPIHAAGTVRFVQPLRLRRDAPAGAMSVRGTFSWQRCDDQNTSCHDGEQAVSTPLTVAGEPLPGADPVASASPSLDLPEEPAKEPPLGLGELTIKSLVLALFMLLQPCTYPMIPVTVSIFSKGRKLTRPQAVTRAAVYGAGIVVSFVLVAGLVTVIFGEAGQGKLSGLATNPWVNLTVGALFVYFAFSFFGYYELSLPAPLQRLMQLGAAQRDSEGTVPAWSLFLMGLFFVLTSYTCGAPVILAVFTTAAGSSPEPHPLAIVYATFVFACAVAAPYVVLSLVPGAVRSLPKSGSWFTVFKVTLGALELCFAFKFFRGADVMWGGHVLARELILGLWGAISLAVAVYLVGRLPFAFPHDPPLRPVSRARAGWAALFLAQAGWAALFLAQAVYLAWGAAGGRLVEPIEVFVLREPERLPGLEDLTAEQLAARLEVSPERAGRVLEARSRGVSLDSVEAIQAATGLEPAKARLLLDLAHRQLRFGPLREPDTRLAYRTDLPGLLEQLARPDAEPAFVMFTGHNCVNCQLMENTILQEEAVAARIGPVSRFALFTDLPGDAEEAANKDYLLDQLKNPGTIPAFYVLGPGGKVLGTQVGGTRTTEAFVEFLERAGLRPGTTPK